MLQTQNLSRPFLMTPFNFSLTPNKNNFNLQNFNQQQLYELNSKMNNDNSSSMTIQEENTDLKLYNFNNDNIPNNQIHQIRTVYDKIAP